LKGENLKKKVIIKIKRENKKKQETENKQIMEGNKERTDKEGSSKRINPLFKCYANEFMSPR